MSDVVTAHLLHAFAIARLTGAPALACIAGVRSSSGLLGLSGAPKHWTAPAGLVEIAVLADLALGASVRTQAGADKQMPTLSMTIDLAGTPPPAARLDVATAAAALHERFASTAGTLRDGGRAIGHCAATFAVASANATLLPWERQGAIDAVHPLAEDDLDAAEEHLLHAIRAAGDRCWSDAVLEASITESTPLQITASDLLANRFGTVQGGLLFALAARAASQAAEGSTRVRGGHVDFLSAGDVTQPLDTAATVLSAGRRTSFIRSDIRQGPRLVATGSFVLQAVSAHAAPT
ncbi:acyl-CoA thioesterase domain-containing protein [Mycobacterium sp. AT1]|uniref:acyl-CoA thioesterase domain-containing protein n=1 Tax=Mycobacterium sp. AT1 TaxID=1961706 RepID=UPI00114F54F4|nr:acyl-CoA thioesterase domain-containing protein [Mycobacterium sp. AT1]